MAVEGPQEREEGGEARVGWGSGGRLLRDGTSPRPGRVVKLVSGEMERGL